MTSKKMPIATSVSTSAQTAFDAPLCRIVGYERVSTEDQVMDVQTQALKKLGCDIIFSEKVSAVSAKRPQFHLMKKFVEHGDTIAVYAFSRLSRNLKELLTFVDDMKVQGVKIVSTSEPHIDPYTTSGRMVLSMTGAIDENERGRVRDRTRDAMQEKIRSGMYIGRPPKVSPTQAKQMKAQRKAGIPVPTIAAKFKVSNSAVYSHT